MKENTAKIGKSNTKSEIVKNSFYEINLDNSKKINSWSDCSEKDNTDKMVVIEREPQTEAKMLCDNGIGSTVRHALELAGKEKRLVRGLRDSLRTLNNETDEQVDPLFCIMAEPVAGDSATHMHEVLLEAYCYENGIYIIKVDSPSKLCRIIGLPEMESCVLVKKPKGTEQYADVEDLLIDHCEAYWDDPIQPIIQLPES